MQTQQSIVDEIVRVNYEYERKHQEEKISYANFEEKLMFEYENYLKIILEQILPQIYLRKSAEKEDVDVYLKIMKPHFLPDIKKELASMEKEEKNFELNLKTNLTQQVASLTQELRNYGRCIVEDREVQKKMIDQFFLDNQANFLVIIKASPELALSLARDSKIIYFQFLFFKKFAQFFKPYFDNLDKKTELTRLCRTYFYYSDLNIKVYFAGKDLLALDDKAVTRNMTNKINIRMLKSFVEPEVYLMMKKISLKNNNA